MKVLIDDGGDDDDNDELTPKTKHTNMQVFFTCMHTIHRTGNVTNLHYIIVQLDLTWADPGGCPGCPDTRPFDTVPFFEKNIFCKHLAEQGASLFAKTKQERKHRFPIYAF